MSVVELFGFSSVREDGVTGVTMLTRMTGCIGLYYGVLGSTELYWISLGFTELHWAAPGCSGLGYAGRS